MSWIAPRLTKRVQILIPRLEPNVEGGSDLVFGNPFGDGFGYGEFSQLSPVLTVWMDVEPKGSGSRYVRGEQINEAVTHEFVCRHNAVASLGREFGTGFSSAFKFMPDLMGLKSDYFLFVQNGSAVKGRLFRIHEVVDNKEQKEYLTIDAEEIEERGTGYLA